MNYGHVDKCEIKHIKRYVRIANLQIKLFQPISPELVSIKKLNYLWKIIWPHDLLLKATSTTYEKIDGDYKPLANYNYTVDLCALISAKYNQWHMHTILSKRINISGRILDLCNKNVDLAFSTGMNWAPLYSSGDCHVRIFYTE